MRLVHDHVKVRRACLGRVLDRLPDRPLALVSLLRQKARHTELLGVQEIDVSGREALLIEVGVDDDKTGPREYIGGRLNLISALKVQLWRVGDPEKDRL